MFHIPISAIKYLCAKYTYFCSHRGEKTQRTDSEDTTHQRRPWTPHLRKKGKSPKPNQRRRRETVSVTTGSGDRDVVEEKCNYTSERAQILIGEIMGCNRDLKNIKQNINDVQNKMKNIIDVLGRI
ncbi:hypothetical protein AB205_0021580 [Aquarana catesbeiana]|uniref:Uncharacterized protein n=1 Tax=Aquarana catesbeiana TaxID=8400 RepID=A0A2G9RCJ1_AQUCT|nr:hypothetical protein AB205_0021580 [Aquarana catesbeiana]